MTLATFACLLSLADAVKQEGIYGVDNAPSADSGLCVLGYDVNNCDECDRVHFFCREHVDSGGYLNLTKRDCVSVFHTNVTCDSVDEATWQNLKKNSTDGGWPKIYNDYSRLQTEQGIAGHDARGTGCCVKRDGQNGAPMWNVPAGTVCDACVDAEFFCREALVAHPNSTNPLDVNKRDCISVSISEDACTKLGNGTGFEWRESECHRDVNGIAKVLVDNTALPDMILPSQWPEDDCTCSSTHWDYVGAMKRDYAGRPCLDECRVRGTMEPPHGNAGASCILDGFADDNDDAKQRCSIPSCTADRCHERRNTWSQRADNAVNCNCTSPLEVLVPCVKTQRPFANVGGRDALCGTWFDVEVGNFSLDHPSPDGYDHEDCLVDDGATKILHPDAISSCTLTAAMLLAQQSLRSDVANFSNHIGPYGVRILLQDKYYTDTNPTFKTRFNVPIMIQGTTPNAAIVGEAVDKSCSDCGGDNIIFFLKSNITTYAKPGDTKAPDDDKIIHSDYNRSKYNSHGDEGGYVQWLASEWNATGIHPNLSSRVADNEKTYDYPARDEDLTTYAPLVFNNASRMWSEDPLCFPQVNGVNKNDNHCASGYAAFDDYETFDPRDLDYTTGKYALWLKDLTLERNLPSGSDDSDKYQAIGIEMYEGWTVKLENVTSRCVVMNMVTGSVLFVENSVFECDDLGQYAHFVMSGGDGDREIYMQKGYYHKFATTLEVSDSTFTGGQSLGMSGSIQWAGGSWTRLPPVIAHFQDCTFTRSTVAIEKGMVATFRDCTFEEADRAVSVDSAFVAFQRCKFTECNGLYGSAFIGGGQDMRTTDPAMNVQFMDSDFIDCVAKDRGGAMLLMESSYVMMRDSRMTGCTAAMGGAIFAMGSGAGLTLLNVTFNGNEAWEGGGGALALTTTTDSIKPQEYITDVPTAYDISGSTFVNNSAKDGGAIHAAFSSIAIHNSTFTENTALDRGGAVFLQASEGGSFARVGNVTFKTNDAFRGGAFMVDLVEAGVMELHDVVINDNKAMSAAAGAYVQYRVPRRSVNEYEYTRPYDNGGVVSARVPGDEMVPASYLLKDRKPFRMVNAVITDNVCQQQSDVEPAHGGGIFFYPYYYAVTTPTAGDENPVSVDTSCAFDADQTDDLTYVAHIEGSRLEGNTAKYGAGGCIALAERTSLKLHDTTIRNCSARSGGGIAVMDAAYVRVSQSVVDVCTATVSGGAAYGESNSMMSFDGTNITNCTADALGGGIALDVNATAGMTSTRIHECEARQGGGIFSSGAGVFLGWGSEVKLNSCTTGGGGVTVTKGNVVLENAALDNNTATNGGGLVVSGLGRAHIANSRIRRNYARHSGGGANFDAPYVNSGSGSGSIVLDASMTYLIETNALIAGAASNLSGIVGGSAREIVNSTIDDNTADVGGGGVFWSHLNRNGTKVLCQNCVFSGNRAMYGKKYATEMVLWDSVPMAQANSTLAAMSQTSANEIANTGRVSKATLRRALDRVLKPFRSPPGEIIDTFDVIVIDGEGQRSVTSGDQFRIVFTSKASEIALIDGTNDLTHSAKVPGSAVFSDLKLGMVRVYSSSSTLPFVSLSSIFITYVGSTRSFPSV